MHPLAAVLTALVAGALGCVVPRLIRWLPEPVPDPVKDPVQDPVQDPGQNPGPPPAEEPERHDRDEVDAVEVPLVTSTESPRVTAGTDPRIDGDERPTQRGQTSDSTERKELYADIGGLPGLGWKAGVVAALAAGAVGGAVGLDWRLLPWVAFIPVGVALGLIDWRTKLLPTKLVAPSYFLVVGLAMLAALLDRDAGLLRTAGFGWLVWGGLFGLMWLIYPRGMGYGDVRLSGVLGILLGLLGWPQMLVGLYATFLVGPLGGLVLVLLRRATKRRYPFGPFMLIGALIGVLAGPSLLSGLGW